MSQTEFQTESPTEREAGSSSWEQMNQAWLTAALAEVKDELRGSAQRTDGGEPLTASGEPAGKPLKAQSENPPALERLCDTFELSSFERRILLMCAGVELDSEFTEIYRAASTSKRGASSPGDQTGLPTFALALAAFSQAHWSALLPERPLRYWHLVEIVAGDSLTGSRLRIDESVLHYLVGTQSIDERLHGLTASAGWPAELAASQNAVAERLANAWAGGAANSHTPVVQVCGPEPFARRGVAAAACARLGLGMRVLSAALVPRTGPELDLFIRLWEREAALTPSCLLIEQDLLDQSAQPEAWSEIAVGRLLETARGTLILSARERHKPLERLLLTFDVPRSSASEQTQQWKQALGPAGAALNGSVDTLVAQFSLSVGNIRAAAAEAHPDWARALPAQLEDDLWQACRRQARPRLDGLAQRIEPVAQWDDLVLPERQKQLLAQMVTHVRQRTKVYKTWGFAARGTSGLGLCALFAGASGTGKTMAGEVIANQLRLDLYRIDLSAVVSKYIGETEKNLRRVFDAAEEGASILLFDEADALFGKRMDARDPRDRYANMEVSYLLQRIESYRGLAILTSNRREALDFAFLRRIRFIVEFPFPEFAQRAEMWQRAFPSETPTEGLRIEKLARLHAAGGNIRNIALGAAFLAAEAGEPVRMSHLRGAARNEFAKLERPLSDQETAGWA